MGSLVMYSAHGPQFNVRQEYDRLPLQFFWTFVTGKGCLLSSEKKAKAMRSPSTCLVLMHVFRSWALIALAMWIGNRALSSTSIILTLAGLGLSWLITVNRTRSLQALFHHLTHGAVLPHRRLAQLVATMAFTAPVLYQSWRTYCKSHVNTHHHFRVLCSEKDPDQHFIANNGFGLNMNEKNFWWKVWTQPFSPSFLWGQVKDSWLVSFVEPGWFETLYRVIFLAAMTTFALTFGYFGRLLLLFWVPVWLLFRHSMWLQLITEHFWFAPSDSEMGSTTAYGRLTWGRFQGRPLPRKGLFSWIRWWALLVLCDLPVRLYVYPQDLSNHDFHHRLPLAPYHKIADLRRTCECEATSRFGPLNEVWGFLATLRVLRDHLCYSDSIPFRYPSTSKP